MTARRRCASLRWTASSATVIVFQGSDCAGPSSAPPICLTTTSRGAMSFTEWRGSTARGGARRAATHGCRPVAPAPRGDLVPALTLDAAIDFTTAMMDSLARRSYVTRCHAIRREEIAMRKRIGLACFAVALAMLIPQLAAADDDAV